VSEAPRATRSARAATVRATLQAVGISALGVLPAFLTGALAVQIRADLHVGLGLFGLAAGTLFIVSGLCARPAGRLVQRLGARRGTALASVLSICSLIALAFAQSAVWLMAALVIGGLGNAVAQPSANLGISEFVSEQRLGVAFGIKQSSMPTATLLGGLSVPTIAVVFGWRWAVVAGAVLGFALLIWSQATGRDSRGISPPASGAPDKGLPRGGLVVLTIGGFLAAAASTSTGVFFVDSAVVSGMAPGTAGLVVAGCSVLGVISRIGFGWLADRRPDRSRYLFIANLLAGGAIGYGLLATGELALVFAGAVLAYCMGWAWTGLFHFAIIKDNRHAAASVTGFVQTGLSLGAAGGPLLFGIVAEQLSYTAAWTTAAALSLVAAATIRIGRRMVRRSRGLPIGALRRRTPIQDADIQAPT
jgi:MFS family permease